MRLDRNGTPFRIIGENIHATRILKRTGKHAVELPDGTTGIGFEVDGERLVLPVHPALAAASDFAKGRIKHVASAVRWGLDGAEFADVAAAYVRVLAARQEAAGADWLDLNADEVSPDSGMRAQAMAWLVDTIEATAKVPMAIDSSDVAVLAAGVSASRQLRGTLLINSASLERAEVLEIAAASNCAVILSASAASGMPAGVDDRVHNAITIVELALAHQIPAGFLYVDPLVLPVAAVPDAPAHVLEAARQLRIEYGDDIHLTGGLSNVSFGMPGRKFINDAFIDLAADAGIDSGIIDPVASDLTRVFSASRSVDSFQLAADVLEGRDLGGMEYVMAFREGRLTEE